MVVAVLYFVVATPVDYLLCVSGSVSPQNRGPFVYPELRRSPVEDEPCRRVRALL